MTNYSHPQYSRLAERQRIYGLVPGETAIDVAPDAKGLADWFETPHADVIIEDALDGTLTTDTALDILADFGYPPDADSIRTFRALLATGIDRAIGDAVDAVDALSARIEAFRNVS